MVATDTSTSKSKYVNPTKPSCLLKIKRILGFKYNKITQKTHHTDYPEGKKLVSVAFTVIHQ